jgi:ankyrin repeat protein
LEHLIDELTRTKRWVFLDEATLQQLVRDGWMPSDEELSEFFLKAIALDELTLIKGLIDIGADPNGRYWGTGTSALMMVQAASAARLLLERGANPGVKNDYGGTPLGWSRLISCS